MLTLLYIMRLKAHIRVSHEPVAWNVPLEDSLLPNVAVEVHQLARGWGLTRNGRPLGFLRKPQPQIFVKAPSTCVQLFGGISLEDIARHRIKHEEQRAWMEFFQMTRLECRWGHLIAAWDFVRRPLMRIWLLCPRGSHRRVERTSGVEIEAHTGQVCAKS